MVVVTGLPRDGVLEAATTLANAQDQNIGVVTARLTSSPPPPARAISITSAAQWRLRTSTRSVRRPSVAGKA